VSLYAKLLILLAGIALGFMGGWRVNDWRHASNERDRLQAESAATAAKAAATFRTQENRDAEILRTGDQLADALGRLRRSSAVRAAAVPASGAGASPERELPDENREALLRLGAEADRLRADFAACREFAYPVK
jgi:hypothetical protein